MVPVVICWKIRIFAYWTTPFRWWISGKSLLWFAEKFVSLLIEQHRSWRHDTCGYVVICWKIRIFAYWTTPVAEDGAQPGQLWFAEKFVSLLIEQHHVFSYVQGYIVVICWKIRIFAYWTTPAVPFCLLFKQLWFAEKFVSLLIEQHHGRWQPYQRPVVICWKIRIFAYWTTPYILIWYQCLALWFAEKFVSLLIEQHP